MSLKLRQGTGDIIGLVPAAGHARRLAHLPCSKEIFPIGFWNGASELAGRPKAVCHYLLERMHRAGVQRVYVILRRGKWDIPACLAGGDPLGLQLAYLVARVPWGPPFTLDEAYPFVRDALILTGFPDVIFEPEDAFVHLLDRQADTGADIVLGLFPARRPDAVDMVEVDAQGHVRGVEVKPARTDLRYTWIIAAWTPRFTEFQHAYLKACEPKRREARIQERQELHLGDVIRAALQEHLHVESVCFPAGNYLDIGTPEDLLTAVRLEGAPSTPRSAQE